MAGEISVPEMVAAIKASGMSQIGIAQSLNVSPTLVTFWKQGRTTPAAEELQLLQTLYQSLVTSSVDGKLVSAAQSDLEETSYAEWLAEQIEEKKIAPITLAERAKVNVQTINLILNGQTQNPQRGTRERIQNALDSLSKGGKQVPEQPAMPPAIAGSADNLHIGIPFTRDEIDEAPMLVGVYVVHDRRGHPTYIGSGVIRTRLKKHWDSRAFVDERVASTFSYYVVQLGDSGPEKEGAVKQSRDWERVIIKFAGNTLLLNTQLRESLDLPEED